MKQQKRRKKNKRKKLRIFAGTFLGIVLAGFFFYQGFQIRHIQVEGNTRYTNDEIKEMTADNPWMFNTVLLTTFHPKEEMQDVPFIDSIEYEMVSYDTICIHVTEKKVVGYAEFDQQKVYFDKDGIVLECVKEESAAPKDGALTSETISASEGSQNEALTADNVDSARVTSASFQPSLDNVPLVNGLDFSEVTVGQQLPVSNPAVFRTMLALTRMIEKYKITPDSVEFTEEGNIILYYYDTVRINLGSDSALEEKMIRTAAILPSLEGKSGVLHMEDYTENTESFVFSQDTSEN